jgi:hypothetical protein
VIDKPIPLSIAVPYYVYRGNVRIIEQSRIMRHVTSFSKNYPSQTQTEQVTTRNWTVMTPPSMTMDGVVIMDGVVTSTP